MLSFIRKVHKQLTEGESTLLTFDNTLTVYICPEDKSSGTFDKWVGEFAKSAPDGFTASEATGGWLGEDGNFVTEKIVRFTVWGATDAIASALLKTLDNLRKAENQEAVSVEINRQPYVCFSTADLEQLAAEFPG